MKRRIRAIILHWLRPRTFSELMDTQLAMFPGGEINEEYGDEDGQLIIYTAMVQNNIVGDDRIEDC